MESLPGPLEDMINSMPDIISIILLVLVVAVGFAIAVKGTNGVINAAPVPPKRPPETEDEL